MISREGQRQQLHLDFISQIYIVTMFITAAERTEVEWLLAEGEEMNKENLINLTEGRERGKEAKLQ